MGQEDQNIAIRNGTQRHTTISTLQPQSQPQPQSQTQTLSQSQSQSRNESWFPDVSNVKLNESWKRKEKKIEKKNIQQL